jgi:hypothetical protein
VERTAEFLRAKRITAAAAFTVLGILSVVIIRQDSLRHLDQVRDHVAADANEIAHGLEDKLFSLELFADRLGIVAGISGDVSPEILERTADEILQHYPDIIAVAIAPDLKITHVAPREGNEQALGLNYRDVPDQFASVAKAIRTGSTTLSAPTELVQGGRSYILRHPVFVSGSNGKKDALWGVVSIAIPEDDLMYPLGFDDEHGAIGPLEIAFKSLSGDGRILGSAEVYAKDPVLQAAEFLNNRWEVAAAPSNGWPSTSPNLLPIVAVLLVLTTIMTAISTWIQRLSKQRERALKSLTNAVDALNAGFVLYDEDDRLVVCNDRFAAPFGLTKAEMRPGMRYATLIRLTAPFRAPEDQGQSEEDWIGERLRRHGCGQEFVVREPEGAWVKVSERRTADGFSVTVVSDITEQKDAQLAAEAANREKTEFLSNVTHELRTPLTVINGFAQLLATDALLPQRGQFRASLAELAPSFSRVREAGLALDAAVAQYGHKIAGSAQHMLTMVNDLLDWAEVERGRLHLEPRDVSVEDMVNQVVDDLRSQAEGKGLSLSADCEGQVIHADSKRLQQVLYNLIGNAIKFTDSGSIMVGVRLVEDVAVFVVEDTGCGIPAEHIERIFERFHQVDNSSTRSYGGFGLGLAIANEIVTAHGGRMWATSIPDKGSRFFFTLPQGKSITAVAA